MKTWNVHYGIRLIRDIEIEAETKEEAFEKAQFDDRLFLDETTFTYFEFANDDYDVWEIKED